MGEYDRWYDKPLAAIIAGGVVWALGYAWGWKSLFGLLGLFAIQQIWFRWKYGYWQD